MRNANRTGVHAHAKGALGVATVAGLAGLILAPQTVVAAAVESAAATEVSGVDVVGAKERPSSPKYTAPLLDTPQTITIIGAETLKQQNLLSLRDALSSVPGITFGAGEGGGGYGDSINLRGFSANTDLTMDGLRDSAQYTRSDSFNVEQIEVINGSNSAYSGAGSIGGTINLVTKAPKGADATTVSAGVGTDGYARVTADSEFGVREGVAVRLNVMAHRNDVPGRDVEEAKRWGVAPSVAFGLGTPTSVTVSYIHQEDDNIPQYGTPYFRNAFSNGLPLGASSSNYYGYANLDTQESKLDALTAKIRHELNDNLTISNITRWQKVTQYAVVDPPQGTLCLASGINPSTGAPCAALGTYLPSGPRGNVRDTENTYLVNQTDFTANFATGGLSHTLVLGFSFSREDFHLDTGNVLRNPGGALPNPTLPAMSIANPDNVWRGPVNYIRSATQDGDLDNRAVYLFDTIRFNAHWELNGGLRYENNEGTFTSATVATPALGGAVVQAPILTNSENLFSYRLGLVYKPSANASLYVAYGNSMTPSKASVNGSCGTSCNVDPEEAVSIELGGKVNLYEGRLQLTGAVFRNERTNYKVASGDPLIPEQVLDGSSRVDGVALGVSGQINDKWTIFANYTYLNSEVLQSVSNRSLQLGGVDAQKGNPLTNTPEHSLSLWTTYQVTEKLTLGYGANYQGEFYLNNAAPPHFTAPSYWVHNAMAAYAVNDRVSLQLNVKNLLDEEYYQRIRNNGWATPGEARSATLTANYRF